MTILQSSAVGDRTAGRESSAARPLSAADYERVEAVASRLQGEIAQLVQRLGDDGTRPRALARRIDADFSLCQRVLAAVRSPSPVDAVRKLPGVDGLRIVVTSIMRAAKVKDPKHPALAAVNRFEELIRDSGGSHARLVRRIEVSSPRESTETHSQDDLLAAAREGMFKHAVGFTGKELDLSFDCTFIRPLPNQPGMLEGIALSGGIGMRSKDGSAILAIRALAADGAENACVQVAPIDLDVQNDSYMIPDFCSRPLPTMNTERVGNSYRTVIDTGGSESADLVFGRRWWPAIDPRHTTQRVWSQKAGIIRPTRRLLVDVYLDESLAASSIPQATAAIATAGISDDPAQNWDRWLPGRRRLEVLGPGLLGAPTGAWPPYAELMQWALARTDWDPQQFVGYRLEETFPVWGTTYMMSFRYPEQES